MIDAFRKLGGRVISVEKGSFEQNNKAELIYDKARLVRGKEG